MLSLKIKLFSSFNQLNLISFSLFLLCFFNYLNYISSAEMVGKLTPYIHRCIEYQSKYICKTAIIKTSSLQAIAVDKKNFACQTRLLAIEANLLMIMNKEGSIKETKNMLNEVNKKCNPI